MASNPKQLKCLTSIGARQVPAHGTPAHNIIGMRVEYTTKSASTLPKSKNIGTYHPVPVHWGARRWKEAQGWHDLESHKRFEELPKRDLDKTFLVDGPGDEVINQVAISQDAHSIKISTNRARSAVFGQVRKKENNYRWGSYAAKDGEIIVGLIVCFGEPEEFNRKANMWSHWAVEHVGVMLQKV
jgi:hypothetical protein